MVEKIDKQSMKIPRVWICARDGERNHDGACRDEFKRLTASSFVCSMLGLLLIFEVIRPFHDMSKDGPLAMILWGVGATIAIIGFFVRPRAVALGIAALLANLIPLCGVAAVLVLLGHSTLIWH
jgi:hypothetical protein